jgi:hypothetical protein
MLARREVREPRVLDRARSLVVHGPGEWLDRRYERAPAVLFATTAAIRAGRSRASPAVAWSRPNNQGGAHAERVCAPVRRGALSSQPAQGERPSREGSDSSTSTSTNDSSHPARRSVRHILAGAPQRRRRFAIGRDDRDRRVRPGLGERLGLCAAERPGRPGGFDQGRSLSFCAVGQSAHSGVARGATSSWASRLVPRRWQADDGGRGQAGPLSGDASSGIAGERSAPIAPHVLFAPGDERRAAACHQRYWRDMRTCRRRNAPCT